jgi:uncharacterized protein YjiK
MPKNLFTKFFIVLVSTTFLTFFTSCRSQETTTPSSASLVSAKPTLSLVPSENLAPHFPSYQQVDNFAKQYDKLSGLVFHPQRKTLFAVTDWGQIIEIGTDGTLIQQKEVTKKADFEGITYNPGTGLLYIVIEGEETILEVNPETLEAGRKIPIELTFQGQELLTRKGKGLEDITFVPTVPGSPTGTFYVVNQSDTLEGQDASMVLEVKIDDTGNEPKASILRYFSVGLTDLSGIYYNATQQRLAIISNENNLLIVANLAGQVLGVSPLPGKKQEGLTIDEAGFLYIAQDRNHSLLKFKPMTAEARD